MSMSVASLSATGRPISKRTLEIRKILDARYSLSFFEEWKRRDPAWWDSSRNEVGHNIYAHGTIQRAFSLGQEVDEASAKARYNDGVLELTLPKKAAAAAKRLAVH